MRAQCVFNGLRLPAKAASRWRVVKDKVPRSVLKLSERFWVCECGTVFQARTRGWAAAGCAECRRRTEDAEPVLLKRGELGHVRQTENSYWYGPTLLERGALPGFGSLARLQLVAA